MAFGHHDILRARPRGREKTILFFQAAVETLTPSDRRLFDGVFLYARDAYWSVRTIGYPIPADGRGHGKPGSLPAIGEILDLWNPDGVIVECAGRPPQFPLTAFGRLPLVLLDSHPSFGVKGVPCVYTDAESIAKAAARELLSRGLSHFAYLPHPADTVWSRFRGEAFAELMRKNGLAFRTLDVPKRGMNSVQLVKSLMSQVGTLPRPCGVFAANDEMARALASACKTAGIDIPNDIAVVGADNDESICENEEISLSSVRIDFNASGYVAAQLLDACMAARRRRPAAVAVESAGVVRRESSRRLPNVDVRVVKALEYIRLHACAGIAPPDVVRKMGCCRRLADLRFTEAMGHTILDEIHAVRIERVKELLMKPDRQAVAIAEACGYDSLADLCRDFKKRTGRTLRGWRTDASASALPYV